MAKYPTAAQQLAGYISTKDITAIQYMRLWKKAVSKATAPMTEKAMMDALLYGTALMPIDEDVQNAVLAYLEEHPIKMPHLP